MTAAPKAVFFDYGGTLDADGVAWKARFAPIYRRAGVVVAAEVFDRAFYHADDSLAAEADPRPDLSGVLHEQVRRVLTGLGGCRQALVDEIAGAFFRESMEHIRKIRPVLARLSGGFRLGIISNNYGNLAAICRQTGLADLVEVLVDSARVGAVKPDPAIFGRALSQMKVRPEEAVMVGDSLARDIRGARAVGMRAVWLSPDDALPPDLAADPHTTAIRGLWELPERLASWT